MFVITDYRGIFRAHYLIHEVKDTSFMVPSPSLNCQKILVISIISVPVQCNLPLLRILDVSDFGGQTRQQLTHPSA